MVTKTFHPYEKSCLNLLNENTKDGLHLTVTHRTSVSTKLFITV